MSDDLTPARRDELRRDLAEWQELAAACRLAARRRPPLPQRGTGFTATGPDLQGRRRLRRNVGNTSEWES